MASDFTNFCCRSGGSNLNAGTRLGDNTEPGTAAALTYASGSWVNATGVFTVASGDPVADGVAVGDFASVYPDAATVTPYVGRVTARTTTTITVPSTNSSGTKPADGTTNTTLKIGGAWAGPNGTEAFPLGFIASACVKATSKHPRVNFKNDQNYDVTAVCTHNLQSATFRGYTSAYEDSGRATARGAASGAAHTIWTVSGANTSVENMIFTRNGDSSSASGLIASGGRQLIHNCVFHTLQGFGLNSNQTNLISECEAYSCNQSGTATQGGFSGASTIFHRCISHDNSASNSSGFVGSGTWIDCIAESNAQYGINQSANSCVLISGCDFYANGSSGVFSALGGAVIENSNFLDNGGYGISAGTTGCNIFVANCGFGSGTMENTSGTINTGTFTIVETGSITYAADTAPWVDAANGDFRINLAAAKGEGRGVFTQTAASYAGTVAYPDVGAGQTDAGAASGGAIYHGAMAGGLLH